MSTTGNDLVFYLIQGILLILTLICVQKLCFQFDYWKKLGISYVKPPLPIIGDPTIFVYPLHTACIKMYSALPNERFYGRYNLWKPNLVLKDPDLIERLMIKDFSHAYNRSKSVEPDNSKLSKHLINYRDEHWKALRNKIIPTFSTGKLKGMHPQLLKCSDSLVHFLSQVKRGQEIEIKEICSRFAMDVISSCAFGLDMDIVHNPNNKFYEIGVSAFTPSYVVKYFFLLQPFLAPIMRKLSVRSIPKHMEEFFVNAVDQTLKYRKENNIVRPDFIQLMHDLKRKDDRLVEKGELNPNDPRVFDRGSLVSNAFVFFAAGFETTATTVGYLFYELARHPNVQEKIHEEIMTVIGKHDGQLTFEAVGELKYLDQAISETMRIHPLSPFIDRELSKDYLLPGTELMLPKGMVIQIPVYGLHHDPQYFPEPEKFIPERFDPQNSILKGTYLPFGAGPRKCIAARFAKLEITICAAMVLKKLRVMATPRTNLPFEYDRRGLLLVPQNGVWISIEERTSNKND